MQQSTTPTLSCPNSFTFTVLGKPAPQGSKRHVGKGVLVESSKRCKPWRQDVRYTAHSLLPDGWYAMMDRAMAMTVAFVFPRPKGHFRANGELKPSAPKHCKGRVGDTSKLVRSTEDALAGIVYNDDAQLIIINAHRRYATGNEQPCAIITITALDD